jgi:hypothetical protein
MTTPPSPPRLATAIVAAACLALAACSPSTPTLSPSPAPSATPTTSAAPTNAPSQRPTTAPAGAVPAGFAPNSVSFVSASAGWVLGDMACGATTCLALFRTSDGGHTWVAAPAPPADFSASTIPQPHDGRTGVSQVRFSDTQDGWAFDPDLWSTHDGGAHWARSNLGIVTSLEAANGAVHAVAVDMSDTMSIESSPTTRDAWTPTGSLQLGAGPVPAPSLVLHGATGWAIENDRTVVDGARLVSGHWASWTPPCSTTGGTAVLGAATASALVAVCQQGNWGPPAPPVVRAYFSTNGGATFHTAGRRSPEIRRHPATSWPAPPPASP